MVNEKLFRQVVDGCGIKLTYLAEAMHLSYQGLLNKMHGKSEFTVVEAYTFQQVTHCDNPTRDAIFYAENVESEATEAAI